MNYKELNDYEIVYLIRENDDEALNLLLKKYDSVITKLTNKYYSKYKYIGISFEDLKQEATVGLMKALRDFNDDQSLLYSFITICCERQLISYCKSYNNLKNYPINFSVDSSISVKDLFYIDSKVDEILLENERFFECKNLLNFDQSIVFELKYNGFTYKEISKLLDLPRSTIDGRISLIRKCLKNNLNINF